MSTRRANPPGLIIPPKRGDFKKTKELVDVTLLYGSSKKRIKQMIITTYETDTSCNIYIGNEEIYCIDVQLMKPTVYEQKIDSDKYGILTKARWDTTCSLDSPFEKGIDTILLLKFMLKLIRDRYPYITSIQFTDMSTKECDNKGSVSLAGMKVFTDGKTWYESHMDVSMDQGHAQLYELMKENANRKKQEIPWESFKQFSYVHQLPIPLDEIEVIYNQSDTWPPFFSSMRDKLGMSRFCIWLSTNGWFDNFLYTRLKFHIPSIQFIITPKSYEEISYRIQPMMGGTRKRQRNKNNR